MVPPFGLRLALTELIDEAAITPLTARQALMWRVMSIEPTLMADPVGIR